LLVLLTLAACGTQTDLPPTTVPNVAMLLVGTPLATSDQATLAAVLTQEQNNTDNQAAATAEIVRANAQATMNSANATLGAAQTQAQNNANVVAAQIAATAEIVRANAQATLNAANSTQSAALTQDAIRQTQTADLATTAAEAMLTQQNKNDLAAGTQTAVANMIATQTQSAVATSQWYSDQSRQRNEQRQIPIEFLWMWCLPVFIVLLAGLVLWGFWRWLKIRQANQRILEPPMEKLPPPAVEVRQHRHDDALPYIEGNVVNHDSKLTKPDDQVSRWLDEVKRKLRSDEKDEDDHTDD
jgi:multidrug efflux pump subunit AcrA (membrane-fusion protein)